MSKTTKPSWRICQPALPAGLPAPLGRHRRRANTRPRPPARPGRPRRSGYRCCEVSGWERRFAGGGRRPAYGECAAAERRGGISSWAAYAGSSQVNPTWEGTCRAKVAGSAANPRVASRLRARRPAIGRLDLALRSLAFAAELSLRSRAGEPGTRPTPRRRSPRGPNARLSSRAPPPPDLAAR
jgi:hypothetical protein